MSAPDFILVHGAWHTPAVWEPLRGLLEAAGHSVAAPDMPFDQTDRFTADCANLITGLGDLSGSVVVSHTSGALIAPVVAATTPVGALAYVNPLLPYIGRSFVDQIERAAWADRGSFGRRYDREARSFWTSEEAFAHALAADCTRDQIAALWIQLRPQSRAVLRDITPITEWPQVPSSAWIYEDDADITIRWMVETVRERLGIEPVMHPGSQIGFYANPEPIAEWLLGLSPRG